MTYELFLALLAFAFVATITPGPNNIMVMASGANFGFIRSIPHIVGITSGFTTLVAMTGLGLGQVFSAWPKLTIFLRVIAFGFLLYLAWKIANAGQPKNGETGSTPLTFWQAAAFQWVNPKAWMMAVSAHSVYAPSGNTGPTIAVIMAFALVSIPCVSAWTLAGTRMRQILSDVRRRRIFNGVMAGLVVLSMAPALLMG